MAEEKIVLLSGPRQTGKTTLAVGLLQDNIENYLNWDNVDDKKIIINKGWPINNYPIVLDEIHKYTRWKSFIKGIWDTNKIRKSGNKFILTGSARLETFKKGGDSLLGRAFHWHLHPFCLTEIKMLSITKTNLNDDLENLLKFGGFPEPFLKADLRFLNRWKEERLSKIIREDLRDLERVQDIDQMRFLLDMIRERVGSTISANNLAKDLLISPRTVQRWLSIFDKMFLTFTIRPYAGKLARAIQKAPKIYFYDNSDVIDLDARYENLVATHLHKEIQFRKDAYGENYELRFIRDKDKREVDFVILKNHRPHKLIEVKKRSDKISSALFHYKNILKPAECYQVVFNLPKNYQQDGVLVVKAVDFLSSRDLI